MMASRVPPCGAGSFLPGQKGTKEPPRGGLRMGTACPYSPAPWTPFYGGPNQAALAVIAKARVDRGLASGNLWVVPLPVGSAPFGLVGLKFGSEGRRAGEGTRPYGGYGNRCIFHVGPGILIGPFPGGPVCPPNEKKHPGFSLGAGHWPARR